MNRALIVAFVSLASMLEAQDFGVRTSTPNELAGDSNVVIAVESTVLSNRVAEISTRAASEASLELQAAYGPRLQQLEVSTNNWTTAFSWGDHVGLYRLVSWVPSWSDVADKPTTFAPTAHTHPHVDITEVPWLTGSSASNLFVRVYDSGGGVWKFLLPGEEEP